METVVINAELLKSMFLSGAANLEKNKEWINELNVFPVPDGDTGTNMGLTIESAAKEVKAVDEVCMKKITKAMSGGSLRGARGNSGVILSQLLRGMCKVVADKEEIDVPTLAAALKKAKETAYKAVMKPKEGTILTVARAIAEKAEELAVEGSEISMAEFLEKVLDYGREVLAQTPEMLPVLKEAGVVDSGGQGLICLCEGAYAAFMGNPVSLEDEVEEKKLEYVYSVEFSIVTDKKLNRAEVIELKDELMNLGGSAVVATEEDGVRIRVLTNQMADVIAKGLSMGELKNVDIKNMRFEKAESELVESIDTAEPVEPEKEEPRKKYGAIAVSIGAGMDEIFKGLNVDRIISGGQTMNPSTEDVLEAIDRVNADNIFVLPNNKNIILAAEQAAKLTANKNIIVLQSRTVPQGIAAMVSFNPDAEPEDNKADMEEAMSVVKTGQVTYAVRNTSIDGKVIHEGDYMGIDDHGISAVGTDMDDTTLELLGNMVDDDSELISIYYGDSIKAEEAEAFLAKVQDSYPDCDVEMYSGNQPVYYYLLSVE